MQSLPPSYESTSVPNGVVVQDGDDKVEHAAFRYGTPPAQSISPCDSSTSWQPKNPYFPTPRPAQLFDHSILQHAHSLLANRLNPAIAAPPRIDNAGNTAFHRAAVQGISVDDLEELLRAGVDVNQPNSAGQLPLHIICRCGCYDPELETFVTEEQNWFLDRTNNIDARDEYATRPLHLASMISEPMVQALLAAGADPAGATCEGLRPLHLATRARQSNIVGILLETLSKAGEISQHVDARDVQGRTPLHYACRSGRSETVELLLAAGADPTVQDGQGTTPLGACTEFEEEQKLWADYWKPDLWDLDLLGFMAIPDDWADNAVGGVMMYDTLRPWVVPGRTASRYMRKTEGPTPHWTKSLGITSSQHTTGLREITDILVGSLRKHGVSNSSLRDRVSRCIEFCAAKGFGYSEGVFRHLQCTINPNPSQNILPTDEEVDECLRWFLVEFIKTCGVPPFSQRFDCANLHIVRLRLNMERSVAQSMLRRPKNVVQYMLRRRYDPVLERILENAFPRPNQTELGSVARLLAEHGLARLLGVMLGPDYGSNIATIDSDKLVDPLLLVAARRELPNMKVLRLLVEEAKTDVNVRGLTGQEMDTARENLNLMGLDNEAGHRVGLNTALHELAQGRHWWHVAQGIPYLLASGADREQRNEAGQTPLEMAESMYTKEAFTKQAIALLRSG